MHERSQRLAEQAQSKTPPQTHYGGVQSAGLANAPAALGVVDAPLPEVLGEAAGASRDLLAQEVHLATSELTYKAKAAGKGAGMLGAAGIAGLFALAALSAAAILALALVLQPWLAALIVGGIYVLVAAVLLTAGRSTVRQATPFVPEQTIRTLGDLGTRLGRAWQRGQAGSGRGTR